MADNTLNQLDQNINDDEQINLADDHQFNRRRHTPQQIQGMEAFFQDCPNPDSNQRSTLGIELGLEPQQVKYWFQNKRTQMKMRNGREENVVLRAENRRLKHENMSHRVHLENASCIHCGNRLLIPKISIQEQLLHAENVRLREEIDRLSALSALHIGNHVAGSDNAPHSTAPLADE